MNPKNLTTFKFIIASALMIGSFSGSYYARLALNPLTPLLVADNILSNPDSSAQELEQAASMAEKVLFDDPKNCKALIILALSYQRRNLTTEAIAEYKKLSSVAEEFAAVSNFNIAVIYQAANNPTEAEKYYLDSIKISSQIPLFEANLIRLYLSTNQTSKAKQRLAEALSRMPSANELIELKTAVGES